MSESYYMRKKRERLAKISEEFDEKKQAKLKRSRIKKTKKLTDEEILQGEWQTLTSLRDYLMKFRKDHKIKYFDGWQLETSKGVWMLATPDLTFVKGKEAEGKLDG